MKTALHLLAAVGIVLAGFTPALGQPQPAARPPTRYVEGELLVKFRGGPRGVAAQQVRATTKHEVKRDFNFIGWQQIRLPAGMTVEEGLARYRRMPDVLAVEPNGLARAIAPIEAPATLMAAAGAMSTVPNDPQFSQQWSLAKIGATNAWSVSTGSTDVVAVVTDSGVNYNHEDLRDNMWRNPGEIPGNGIDDDGNGWVDDVYGIDAINDDGDPFPTTGNYHGTGVAGIIGAVGNNGTGLAGANWSVRIMAIRLFLATELIPLADRLQAFNYILLMKSRGVNIRVVNMSWGDSNFYQAQYDAMAALSDGGILLTAATINNASVDVDVTPDYPGNNQVPGIIVVANSGANDFLSSAYGRTNVDLAAPGVDVPLLWGPGDSAYSRNTGTSFSSPLVAGSVALLAAINPEATAADVKSALLESVDVLPAFTNRMVSNGRLNLGRAVLHPLIAMGAPRIASHPQSQSVIVGSNATFSASVGGTRPLIYQWLFNGDELPDATNATLHLNDVIFSQAGDYSVVVSNSLGIVTSQSATLTIVPLMVTVQPQSQNIRLRSNVTFNVSIISPAPATYQWRFNGADIPDATAATLLITNVQLAREGAYSVRVVNSFGAALSSNAALVVLVNPLITVAPVSQSVVAGGSATFSVGFSGNPSPFGVRWLQLSNSKASNTVARLYDFFTLSNAQPGLAGQWRVVVKNQANTNTAGENRTFNLIVLADSDTDGLPDEWEASFPTAANAGEDTDHDGMTNLQEYQAGTDPTNALSHLKIDSIALASGATAARLRFFAVSNQTYTLESRDAVDAGAWVRVSDVVAVPTNRVIEAFDGSNPSGNSQRYYRLVTPRQP